MNLEYSKINKYAVYHDLQRTVCLAPRTDLPASFAHSLALSPCCNHCDFLLKGHRTAPRLFPSRPSVLPVPSTKDARPPSFICQADSGLPSFSQVSPPPRTHLTHAFIQSLHHMYLMSSFKAGSPTRNCLFSVC